MIPLFGYKLKLVKKKDLDELEQFDRIVRIINQQVYDMVNYITKLEKVDIPIQNQLVLDITGLNTFVDIYFHNKFSSPSSSLLMLKMTASIMKHLKGIMNVTGKCASIVKKAKRSQSEDFNCFDDDDFNYRYREIMDDANRLISGYLLSIVTDLKNISIVVEPDLFRLVLGVDIIKDYKDRQKRFSSDKELMTNFSIRYKVITDDDRRFLEKEKYKNEQSSRTRTSDGRSEETV